MSSAATPAYGGARRQSMVDTEIAGTVSRITDAVFEDVQARLSRRWRRSTRSSTSRRGS